MEDMKLVIHKVQCAFSNEHTKEDFAPLEVLRFEKRGNLCTLTVRGDEETIMRTIYEKLPLFAELIPLTLEEIFISETEVKGYDLKSLLF